MFSFFQLIAARERKGGAKVFEEKMNSSWIMWIIPEEDYPTSLGNLLYKESGGPGRVQIEAHKNESK